MPDVSFRRCGRPLSASEIAAFSDRLGITLPEDYLAFLQAQNGGRPTPNCFPIEGLAKNPFGACKVLFGLDREIGDENLDWNARCMRGRIPPDLLPIGCDGCGNLICLGVGSNNRGQTRLWHYYEERPDIPSTDVRTYAIASSFSEFLTSLRPIKSYMPDRA